MPLIRHLAYSVRIHVWHLNIMNSHRQFVSIIMNNTS